MHGNACLPAFGGLQAWCGCQPWCVRWPWCVRQPVAWAGNACGNFPSPHLAPTLFIRFRNNVRREHHCVTHVYRGRKAPPLAGILMGVRHSGLRTAPLRVFRGQPPGFRGAETPGKLPAGRSAAIRGRSVAFAACRLAHDCCFDAPHTPRPGLPRNPLWSLPSWPVWVLPHSLILSTEPVPRAQHGAGGFLA